MIQIKNLFKRKVSEEELIKEIHSEFDTAPERLLQAALGVINSTSKEKVQLESVIEDKANRLQSLGFLKNGLVDKLEKIKKRNQDKDKIIEMQNDEANLINYYSKEYPFLKFLTENELNRICDKYGLVYAPVKNYKMPVPDKNLAELENAQYLKSQDSPYYLASVKYIFYNWSSLYRNQYITKDDAKKWENPLVFDTTSERIFEHDITTRLRNKYNPTKRFYFDKDIEVTINKKEGLFIAAPKKHFDLTGLTFDKKKGFFTVEKSLIKKDPIVFRYVKGGVQILSKWGLEADDPALQVEILN